MHANFYVTLAFALPILKSSMNNYIDRFAFGKGWKNENKLNSVSRHALSVSRAFESEVLVHSCRTACSVAQRCLFASCLLNSEKST